MRVESAQHPEVELLLTFVRERDVPCPRCGYNIRNLTQPVCPECHEELKLKVGVAKLKLHWLLLTLAPGTFCAIMMGVFLTMVLVLGPPGGMGVEGIMVMSFIGLSGFLTVIGGRYYRRFLRMSDQAQITWALLVWGVHVVAFATALASM